jgi:hypothetical protein
MQHDMRHGHLDLGQFNHLVRMVGRYLRKVPLTTGTDLGPDPDDLRGF